MTVWLVLISPRVSSRQNAVLVTSTVAGTTAELFLSTLPGVYVPVYRFYQCDTFGNNSNPPMSTPTFQKQEQHAKINYVIEKIYLIEAISLTLHIHTTLFEGFAYVLHLSIYPAKWYEHCCCGVKTSHN